MYRYNTAMLHPLTCHPDFPCDAVKRIDVAVTRQQSAGRARLLLRYTIEGAMVDLAIPGLAMAERTDDLWRHTCCEAFLSADDDTYYELNLSPSMQWAAYAFSGYRTGMTQASIPTPTVNVVSHATHLQLEAVIDCSSLPLSNSRWRLGLSAVIEESNGRKSYWALAHRSPPDFHHASAFVLALEP